MRITINTPDREPLRGEVNDDAVVKGSIDAAMAYLGHYGYGEPATVRDAAGEPIVTVNVEIHEPPETRTVHAVVWRSPAGQDGFEWFHKREAAEEYATSETARCGFPHLIRDYEVPAELARYEITGVIYEQLLAGDYDEILGARDGDDD